MIIKAELQELYDEGHALLDTADEKENQQSSSFMSSLDQDAEDEQDDMSQEDDPEESQTPQSSIMTDTSSLDDIMLRFGKSTLLSQSEESSPSLQATAATLDGAAKDDPAERTLEKTDNTPEKEQLSEDASTSENSSTEEEGTIETAKAFVEEKSGAEKEIASERIPPSTASVKVSEPDTPPPSHIPMIAGTDTQAEVSQDQGQPRAAMEASEPSNNREIPEAVNDPIVPKEESPLEEESISEKKTLRSTVSGSHSIPPYVLSPVSSLAEVGLGGDTSQFIPTSTAVNFGADLRQPFSTCVPVTNRLPDVSHFASAISFDSIDSNESKGHGARDGYMVWRKRRIDLDHGVVGEFRYQRGHGALAPHFLPCDRVSKRRRMV